MKRVKACIAAVLMGLAGHGLARDVSAPTTDFSRPEAGEGLPGGATSHGKPLDRDAFTHPSANLSLDRKLDFQIGNGFFKRLWVTAPSSTQAADGLGPLYNARSCQRCHINDGRGHPPSGPDDNAVSMFLRLSIPPQDDVQRRALVEHRGKSIPEPTYGNQLQDFAIAGHKAEGRLHIDYQEVPVELADGTVVKLRKPTYSVADPAYGPLHPETMLSPRIAPQMIGLGLLEAIVERDILARADPDDRDGDGISGRPNRVWSAKEKKVMLGRFGWKAGSVSVDEQSQDAFADDIGISVPLHPGGAGDCTARQVECRQAPNGNSPQYDDLEAPRQVTDLVAFYSRNLAVPARRDHDHPDVLAGKRLFYGIGCVACHRPKYVTGGAAPDPELANQLIWPYTDLLLHDMGEGLADHRPEGDAGGREWRTAPLWGIGLIPVVSGHSNYLHDGRARSLLEAILWHGGEAQPQRDAVKKLSAHERNQLIRFVESL
jgi:CxxC motif-containing protein (DUF1111 family)